MRRFLTVAAFLLPVLFAGDARANWTANFITSIPGAPLPSNTASSS